MCELLDFLVAEWSIFTVADGILGFGCFIGGYYHSLLGFFGKVAE